MAPAAPRLLVLRSGHTHPDVIARYGDFDRWFLARLGDLGTDLDIGELVLKRAKLAYETGCDGVISSGLEVANLRAHVDPRLLVVTPGIRPSKSNASGDQKRIVTVEEAIQNGADYIVVGRPIRDADSPREAAESIQGTIAAAH